MPTNKDILARGIKYAVWALPMFVVGPVIINSSFKNQQHPLFIPVLGMGVIFCIMAVVLLFRALRTILKSQSDK